MAAVLCADGRTRDAAVRVCVVDEAERVLLHSLILPSSPVVDYRTEYTGLRAGDLAGAPGLEAVRLRVIDILAGGPGDAPPSPGERRPRLLVGHGLENDLAVLHLSHPAALLRDTALHAPLQRATTGKAHKLRDLCRCTWATPSRARARRTTPRRMRWVRCGSTGA
jgi:DNA polymerase III epsilon subunit-like protein